MREIKLRACKSCGRSRVARVEPCHWPEWLLGVTAGKASHNASNARVVTAGKMGRNSSTVNLTCISDN